MYFYLHAESDVPNTTLLSPAPQISSIPMLERSFNKAKEDFTNFAIPWNTESSNTGMTWSYCGNTHFPYWKYPLINVQCCLLRQTWILSKIKKKCFKFSSKNSKLPQYTLQFKEFCRCKCFLMEICHRKINRCCIGFWWWCYPCDSCLRGIFVGTLMRENRFWRKRCYRSFEKFVEENWPQYGHKCWDGISQKHQRKVLCHSSKPGRKAKRQKVKIYSSWWAGRWTRQHWKIGWINFIFSW